MALFRDDTERTEAATPRRREEARDRGQVAFSHELSTSLLSLVGISVLELCGRPLLAAIAGVLEQGLRLNGSERVRQDQLPELLRNYCGPAASWVLVLVLVLPVVGAL